MQPWHWFVYIIECKDGSYYTGVTWSLCERIAQHVATLGSRYTSEHGFRRLAYAEEHEDFGVALYRERQIKGWSRWKKEKLINGEWGKEW